VVAWGYESDQPQINGNTAGSGSDINPLIVDTGALAAVNISDVTTGPTVTIAGTSLGTLTLPFGFMYNQQ
jgi:hypothetical protein